jgi:hypothetical protein
MRKKKTCQLSVLFGINRHNNIQNCWSWHVSSKYIEGIEFQAHSNNTIIWKKEAKEVGYFLINYLNK